MEVVILAAYSTGGRWGWAATLVRPGGGVVVEHHDAGARYDSLLAAQQTGLHFCLRYWQVAPQVVRVNGVTLKGRRVDTGGR